MSNFVTMRLEKIVYHYVQNGNTDGTTDEYEELEVTIDNVGLESNIHRVGEYHGYMVLRTKTGISIDEPEELYNLLKEAKRGYEIK